VSGEALLAGSGRSGRIALLAAAGVGYALILLPIVFVCWLSFFSNEIVTFPPQGYTLRWFAHIFDQNNFVSGFLTSLQVGVVAMIGGLVLGVPASLMLARHEFTGREALNTLLVLPLVVPGIVAGTAIYVFQIEIELATQLPLLGSMAGLVFAHIMITIPWTVRLLTASLVGFDRSIEEAALNLGATPLRAFVKVTLPVIKPGIVAAALFSFIISFGNLEMTLFLVAPGQTTLPIAILQYLQWRIDPTIAAVSLLQIVLIGAGMLITDHYVKLTRVL
jgi:putative spermidine/putrescine transport system permease protein